MTRRGFAAGLACVLATTLLPSLARANVPLPYDWNAAPPLAPREAFIAWMQKNRGEDPRFLGERWDRFQALLARHDIWSRRDMRAFLLTPREAFVTARNLDHAYEWHYLDIGVRPGDRHAIADIEVMPFIGMVEISRGDEGFPWRQEKGPHVPPAPDVVPGQQRLE